MGAMDREHRRYMREQQEMKKKGYVENPWRRFTNKVDKWIPKAEARAIKDSQYYKQVFRGSIDYSGGGGGAREGGVGNDPQGWGGRQQSSGYKGISYGQAVGNLGSDIDTGQGGLSFGQAVGNLGDIATGDTKTLTGGSTGTKLEFKNPALTRMTASLADFSSMAQGGFDMGDKFEGTKFDAGKLADEFSSKFGDIGTYEQFQNVTGEYGVETIGMDELGKMTQTEAQDYIDRVGEETIQSFQALQKKDIIENIADLETMQRTQLGRIAETYDPKTATLDERMSYNASVKGLQAVGLAQDYQTDVRMGDYAKLGLGALSALTGNPLGVASMAMNLKKMGNVNYTAMGELAKYGKFNDPSLKNVDLSDTQLNQLGKMKSDIADFATTVRTAEQQAELDKHLTAYINTRDDYEKNLKVQMESVERKQEVEQETKKEDTQQAQGGTEVSITGKRGLQFNRDVSNKGLGDVISVFDQVTTEDEEERLRRETSARARLGLAGIWRG